MTNISDTCDVLVVGAGPTGLALACDLRRRGIDCQVIDRLPSHPASSRGKGLQPRSLEVLDDLGVLEPLLAAGWSRNIRLRWHVAGRLLLDLQLPGSDPLPTVPYPNVVLLPQCRTEQALRDRLTELGGSVQLGWQLDDLAQDSEGVTASISEVGTGDRRTVRSRYLVGCDGGHSRVRDALGLALVGDTHAEHFVFGDVEIDGLDPGVAYVWIDAERYLAASPFPGHRSWQVQATVQPDARGQLEPASLDLFQRLCRERTGRDDLLLSNPTWLSNYVSNVCMVDRYRVGRAFLAGDAAHVHSPAGGQGMNTGIQDAYNLGWKLDLVLRGRAEDALLDTYQEERLPIARSVLTGSDIGYTAMFSSNPVITFARERILVPLLRIPRVQRAILGTSNQLDVNYRDSSLAGTDAASERARRRRLLRTAGMGTALGSRSGPKAGDRAPDAELRDAQGAATRLLPQLHGPQFTLLIFTGEASSSTARHRLDALAARVEARYGPDVHPKLLLAGSAQKGDSSRVLRDPERRAHRTYGATGGALYLVRPDGYVGMRTSPADPDAVTRYLDTVFHTPHTDGVPTGSEKAAPCVASPAASPEGRVFSGVHQR